MEYRVYINGTALNDLPHGLQDLELNIETDDTISGVYYRYTTNLEFYGDGYDTLVTLYDQDGECSIIDVKIDWKCTGDKLFTTLFEGIIMMTKVEWNMSQCTATASIIDNTIQGRIVAKFRTEATLTSNVSLLGDTVTACGETQLDFFTPSTGNYDFLNRRAYKVFEVLSYLIRFVSDGDVQFASNLFDSGGDLENLFILNGKALRQTASLSPVRISLEDVYKELNTKVPLCMLLEDNAGTPRIRIEHRDYLYGNTQMMTCRNIGIEPGLTREFDNNQTWAVVKFGQADWTPQDSTYQYPDTFFQGWSGETYSFSRGCSSDSTLDLESSWYADNNTIEKLLLNPTILDYDEDIFIVEAMFNSPNWEAVKYSDAITTYYYNRNLTNYKSAIRWANHLSFPFNYWSAIASVDDRCRVQQSADYGPYTATTSPSTINVVPYPFNNEIFDNGANFDSAVNYRYTCPRNGLYMVALTLAVELDIPSVANMQIEVNIRRFNSSNILQETYVGTTTIGTQFWNIEFRTDFVCAANDFLNVRLISQTTSGSVVYTMKANTKFEVTSAPGTNLFFPQPEVPKVRRYKYSYPMAKSDWDTIIASQIGYITINPGTDTANDINGYIKLVNYRPNEGIADFELIA